jgi:hypothetical protein
MEWFGHNPVGSIRFAATPTSEGQNSWRVRIGLRPFRVSTRRCLESPEAAHRVVPDHGGFLARSVFAEQFG